MTAVDFQKGAKVERLERNLKDPSPALKTVGALMVAESQEAFRNQSFGGVQWPARRVPNIMGILADFAAGKSAPPERRFQARPALRDTGRLQGSIAYRLGPDYVEVGTNVDYAAVHQKGGTSLSPTITDDIRHRLWAWLRTQPKERKKQLGWLLNRKFRGLQLQRKVPARPFLGVTEQTRRYVRQTLNAELLEVGT